MAAIHQFFGNSMVVGLGITLCKVFAENVVAGRSEAVAAHSAVIFFFVGGLSETGETHDDITSADVGVIDDVGTPHTAGDGAINNDGAHEVAYVSRLAPRGVDADAHAAQLSQELVGAVDDGRDNLARDEHLVAPNGAADEDVIHGPHAQQVIGVHDESVLRDAFPHAEVASLAPVGVCKAALGAGAVGVHDVAVLRVATKDVGNDLAEGLWEDAFVDVLDGGMDVLLGGRDATRKVAGRRFSPCLSCQRGSRMYLSGCVLFHCMLVGLYVEDVIYSSFASGI